MSDAATNTIDNEILLQSNRLQMLSPEEYDALWGLPRFTPSEREIFFALTGREQNEVQKLRTTRTRIHFLLQLGYFRARQRVFRFELNDVLRDVDYLHQRYLKKSASVQNIRVSDHTRKHHIQTILRLFRYHPCGSEERLALEDYAISVARISSKPAYVLRELIDYLIQRRTVLPGYTLIQDIVTRALSIERQRLSVALGENIQPEHEAALDRLLIDREGLYAITAIRHEPRGFTHRQLMTEVRRGEQLRPLVGIAADVIAQTQLSTECVRYYASLIDYYTVYKLRRMSRDTARLYLLCFVQDRFQRLNDNLLTAFCTLVTQ